MSITLTELRSDLYNVVDQVLETGEPLEITRNGRTLFLTPSPLEDKFHALIERTGVVVGDLDDLVDLDWSGEWKP